MTIPTAPAASNPTSNAAPGAIAAPSIACTALIVALFLVTVFGFFYAIATLTGQVGLALLVTAITMANAVREMLHRIG